MTIGRIAGAGRDGVGRPAARAFLAVTVAVLTGGGFAVCARADSNVPQGVIEFLDGASLHGHLQSMNPDQGVAWAHPEARDVIEFRPANISSILFANVRPVVTESRPTSRFRFHNGDELYGTLSRIEGGMVELNTWFGGSLKAPRDAVQSISFFWKGYSLIYEGPSSADGWVLSRGNRGWQYRDGGFVTTAPGILGRDFKLPSSASLEFDLAWNSPFTLGLTFYTETMDRFDYSVSSYMFYLSPGQISLQRMQSGVGVTSLGRAEVPGMRQKNKMRFEFRANKDESMLALLADGHLVHRWKDNAGFVARGGGVVFSSQMEGPEIRLSNIRVSEWDGRFETDRGTNAPVQGDMALLVNRDKVAGELMAVDAGRLKFATAQTTLDIPMDRVTQILLNRTSSPPVVSGSWEVRAHVAGGGSVAFQLERWGTNQVSGTSPTFGRLELHPDSIRRLQFNLGKSRSVDGGPQLNDDPGGFDE